MDFLLSACGILKQCFGIILMAAPTFAKPLFTVLSHEDSHDKERNLSYRNFQSTEENSLVLVDRAMAIMQLSSRKTIRRKM